jgi:hypothetical protein
MKHGKNVNERMGDMKEATIALTLLVTIAMLPACGSSGSDSGTDATIKADVTAILDLTTNDAAPPDSTPPDGTLPLDALADETTPTDLPLDAHQPPPDMAVEDNASGSDLIEMDTSGGLDLDSMPEPDLWDGAGELSDTSYTDQLEDGTVVNPDPDQYDEDILATVDVLEEVAPMEIVPDVPAEEQQFAEPAMSTWIARKAKFEKPVQVSCRTISGLGEIVDNPGAYEISFSALDVQQTEDGYLFPTPGTYTVTCTDMENELEGTAEFVVAHDMLTPTLTQLSSAFSDQHTLLDEALAAVKAEDDALLDLKLEALKKNRIRTGATVAAVAQTPPGGWPAQATIDLIVEGEPDDEAYELAVHAIAVSMVQLNLDITALAADPTLDNVGTVEATLTWVREKAEELDALDVSDRARYAARADWDSVIAEIQLAQDAYLATLGEMLANADQWEAEPCPGCFTLVELVVSMAIQATLSALPSYNKLLIEAGKCAASMAVMLMISDAIDASVSGPDAPTIQYNMPGYGNAVNDGSALSLLVDGFDAAPGNNVVLFISPNIGDTVVNVVDAALSTMKAIKSLGNWDNVFELGGAIVDAYNALTGDLALMEEDIPGLMSDGVVPMPVLSVEPFMEPGSGFWEFMVNLPPLPECNDGWLPKIGLLVPINFQRGNGPSYKLVILP